MNGITQPVQRKSRRLPVRLPFSLALVSESQVQTFPAQSIDLSKSGLRVRTATQFTSGQTLEVTLLEGPARPVPARVVWAGSPTAANEYEFGLEYISGSAQAV